MDNTFDKDYYGEEPQRPFNEHPEPPVNADNPYASPVAQAENELDPPTRRLGPQSAAAPEPPMQQFAPQPCEYAPEPPAQQFAPQPGEYAPEPPVQQYAPQPGEYAPEPPVQQYAPQAGGFVPEPPVQQYVPRGNGFAPEPPVQPYIPRGGSYPPGQAQTGFEPQRPFMTKENAASYPQQEFAYNPIQHTATYSYGMPPQPPSQAQSGRMYSYPQQPPVQPGAYEPPRQPAGVPEAAAAQSARDNGKSGKKSGVNKALVAVIIIMGVLLVSSLGAFVWYAANNNKDSGKSSSISAPDEDYGFDFTMPGDGGTIIPNATEPPVHDESDYSDKADKNYQGLALNDKPQDAQTNTGYTAEYAFKSASDSVVSVRCYSTEISDTSTVNSEGSGIIISADGYVVTNAHVIGNSKTAYAIQIVTADGTKYKAGVVGYDQRTDLAVLKLDDAKDLKPAVFGDSDKLGQGEDIIIIGNPGGIEYQNSMTKGVVSAFDRSASNKNMVKYFQTDAAINPGNSGGPAVNLYGQVVGVASAKIADEMYEGMCFCIPSQTVKQITDSLIKNGYVENRVRIGITGTAVTNSDAQSYGVPLGIAVDEIDPSGPCADSDLQPNDIITEFDGISIKSFSEIYEALEGRKPGDKVKIKYYRDSDGKDHETEIVLQEDKP